MERLEAAGQYLLQLEAHEQKLEGLRSARGQEKKEIDTPQHI
jgi:hypothetical protein